MSIETLYAKLKQTLNVDEYKRQTKRDASIFIRVGDDFIRVSTTILDEQGKIPVNSVLDKDSEPYKQLIKGNEFIGEVTILGTKYFTKYAPFITEGNNRVVVAFVVGIIKK